MNYDFSDAAILLVDDNPEFLELMKRMGKGNGLNFSTCSSPLAAINQLSVGEWDVVVTDVSMPDLDGLDFFRVIRDRDPQIPVILITQYGSSELAVEVVKEGAYHFFEKPIKRDQELFWRTLKEAVLKARQERELSRLRQESTHVPRIHQRILGVSDNIRNVRNVVMEVAPFDIPLLITGETGTGKGLVARAVHDLSARSSRGFLAVNCTELPENLLESTLFGHTRGAYTGAVEKGVGFFEMAHGGTLFLDEMGDASSSLQTKLLRVLEEKTFHPVGSSRRHYSDFRLITATNQDLEKAIEKGSFRQDLYYRINMYRIQLQPLRERKEDIVVLARRFVEVFNEESGLKIKGLTSHALDLLCSHDWPGNVRELRNVVVRASVSCRHEMIRSEDVSRHLPTETEKEPRLGSLNLKEMERHVIHLALVKTGYNQSKAAKLLGVSRNTLIAKIKLYGLSEED